MPQKIIEKKAEKVKKIKSIYQNFLIQLNKLDHEQFANIKALIEEMDKKRQEDIKNNLSK